MVPEYIKSVIFLFKSYFCVRFSSSKPTLYFHKNMSKSLILLSKLGFNKVACFNRSNSGGCASENDITAVECGVLADVLDELGNLEDHVPCVVSLHVLLIYC